MTSKDHSIDDFLIFGRFQPLICMTSFFCYEFNHVRAELRKLNTSLKQGFYKKNISPILYSIINR